MELTGKQIVDSVHKGISMVKLTERYSVSINTIYRMYVEENIRRAKGLK